MKQIEERIKQLQLQLDSPELLNVSRVEAKLEAYQECLGYITEQKLNLSGIVRPEGERPSDEEIIHALDLAQCEIKAMYSKTGYITSNVLVVVNRVHKSLKAAAKGGEPLPAEGVAQSGRGGRCPKCSDYGIVQDEYGRNSNCECHY